MGRRAQYLFFGVKTPTHARSFNSQPPALQQACQTYAMYLLQHPHYLFPIPGQYRAHVLSIGPWEQNYPLPPNLSIHRPLHFNEPVKLTPCTYYSTPATCFQSQVNTECMHFSIGPWGQNYLLPPNLSIRCPLHSNEPVKPTPCTYYSTPTTRFQSQINTACTRLVSGLGGKITCLRPIFQFTALCASTRPSNPYHILTMDPPPVIFNGRSILSACAWYRVLEVKSFVPSLSGSPPSPLPPALYISYIQPHTYILCSPRPVEMPVQFVIKYNVFC